MIKGKFYQAMFLALLILAVSCETTEPSGEIEEREKIIPQETLIHVPSSLKSENGLANFKVLSGDVIFNYIRDYISVTDKVAEVVETSYKRIFAVENSGALEFTYTGIDGKTKNVSIRENYVDSVSSWDYYMEIYNETFADLALRAWWNKSPFEQKIYLRPSSLNTTIMTEHTNAIVEIDYRTGDAATPYEKSMFIAVDGLTGAREISFDPENILIFIGQGGSTLDISGASSNPDAVLLNNYYRGGRNWTFLARVNTSENIAAAKLALPLSSIKSNEELFNDYSPKKVVLDEIKIVYPGNDHLSDSELFSLAKIDGNLFENPAYFDHQGFLSTDQAPSTAFSNLADFEGLIPYSPAFVRDYSIKFEKD